MTTDKQSQQSNDPKTVAHRARARLAVGDMDGVANECLEDVVWRMMGLEKMLPNGGLFKGRAAVEEFFGMAHQLYDFNHLKLDITAIHVDGPFVIMEFTMDAPVLNGRHHHDERIIVFRIIDGKICAAHEYADSLKVKTDLLDP
jgi:ketosteroid isomerase-like protein